MEVRRRRNGDGIDAAAQQTIGVGKRGAAERASNLSAAFAIRIGNADQLHPRHVRKNPGMIAAHDADANHADTQGAFAAQSLNLSHDPKAPHYPGANPVFPLAYPISTGDRANVGIHTQIASPAYD